MLNQLLTPTQILRAFYLAEGKRYRLLRKANYRNIRMRKLLELIKKGLWK